MFSLRGVFGVATIFAILVVFLIRLQFVLLVNVLLLSLIADSDCGRKNELFIALYVFPALLCTNTYCPAG